jgi:hypothetical protein
MGTIPSRSGLEPDGWPASSRKSSPPQTCPPQQEGPGPGWRDLHPAEQRRWKGRWRPRGARTANRVALSRGLHSLHTRDVHGRKIARATRSPTTPFRMIRTWPRRSVCASETSRAARNQPPPGRHYILRQLATWSQGPYGCPSDTFALRSNALDVTCASNMRLPGREVQAEWPGTLLPFRVWSKRLLD